MDKECPICHYMSLYGDNCHHCGYVKGDDHINPIEYHYMQTCCTIKIIGGFGGTENCDQYAARKGGLHTEILAGYIMERAKWAWDNGNACIVATTNNEQTVANKVLENLGFKSTGFMRKSMHPNTQVCMWWLELAPYFEEDK